MSDIAEDFLNLLPDERQDWDGPWEWLWVFDPVTGQVTLDHNHDRVLKDSVAHDEIAPHVVHPERQEGFVYKIKDGYRITDGKNKKLEDPFIIDAIHKALHREHTPKPLPKIKPPDA